MPQVKWAQQDGNPGGVSPQTRDSFIAGISVYG